MDYACIGSGSSGNAAVIKHGDNAILLDCGLTIKETVRRLDQLSLHPSNLLGIVVTHEHGDHISGVAPFARRYNLPVWMTRGTQRRARDARISDLKFYCAEQSITIGPFELRPFVVPHDAAEACQFVISVGDLTLAILTDLGMITPHVVDCVKSVTAIVLECNHDEEMLANGPYPPALQARVGGHHGHLSNRQAAGLLQQIDTDSLQFILLAHLSEKNNTPEKALAAIEVVLPDSAVPVSVLSQSRCSEWFSLR